MYDFCSFDSPPLYRAIPFHSLAFYSRAFVSVTVIDIVSVVVVDDVGCSFSGCWLVRGMLQMNNSLKSTAYTHTTSKIFSSHWQCIKSTVLLQSYQNEANSRRLIDSK